MITFFIGLTLGTCFGFLIGAIMTDAKFADERVEREQEEAADRPRYEAETETSPLTLFMQKSWRSASYREALSMTPLQRAAANSESFKPKRLLP